MKTERRRHRLVLHTGNARSSLVAVPPAPASPERLASASIPAPGPEAGPEAVEEFAEALASAFAEAAAGRPVVLAPPESWIEHRLLETPKLRRLDALGLVQREVAETTTIDPADLLLGEALFRSGGGRGRKRVRIVRAIAASAASRLVGLARALGRRGLDVVSVRSGAASFLLGALEESIRSKGADRPRAFVLLRGDGLALLVADGPIPRQLRVLDVRLPEDPDGLVGALSEELRRSSVFFRESHHGRDVEEAFLFGSVATDPDELAGGIQAATGIDVTPELSPDEPDADVLLEAAAVARADRTLGRGALELLPEEERTRRRLAFRVGATLAAVGAGAVLVLGAHRRLQADALSARESLARIEQTISSLEPVEEQRDEWAHLLAAFEERRDALGEILAASPRPAQLLARLAASLPADLRIEQATLQDGRDRLEEIRLICVADLDAWEAETRVASFFDRFCAEGGFEAEIGQAESSEEGANPRFEVWLRPLDSEEDDAAPGP